MKRKSMEIMMMVAMTAMALAGCSGSSTTAETTEATVVETTAVQIEEAEEVEEIETEEDQIEEISESDANEEEDNNSGYNLITTNEYQVNSSVGLADLNVINGKDVKQGWAEISLKEPWSDAVVISDPVEYFINGKYNYLTFTVAPSRNNFDYDGIDHVDKSSFSIRVTGDDDIILCETPEIYYQTEPMDVKIDVTGQDYVKIERIKVMDGGNKNTGTIYFNTLLRAPRFEFWADEIEADDQEEAEEFITEEPEEIAIAEPINLLALDPIAESQVVTRDESTTTREEVWNDVIEIERSNAHSDLPYLIYDVGGKYSTLTFTMAPSKQEGAPIELLVLGDDDQILWKSDEMDYKTPSQTVTIDITGQNRIGFYIVTDSYRSTLLIKDAILQ